MRGTAVLVALGAVSALGAAAPSGGGNSTGSAASAAVSAPAHTVSAAAAAAEAFCSADLPPLPAAEPMPAPIPGEDSYYAIPLVTTKKIPGTARSHGVGRVSFAPSPYGVALSPNGSFVYVLHLQLQEMKKPSSGVLVGWVTTPQVDKIERLGAFDADMALSGEVSWNKYLVVITLEPTDDPSATTWSGPIVMRGMSRSGAMHTMAGHGPFQQELCAKYGYS